MKRLHLVLVLVATFFFSACPGLFAQAADAEEERIVISPDELKAMIRKMAELRRRRYMLLQRQRAMVPRRSAAARNTVDKETEVITREIQILVKEDADGNVDTLISVDEGIRSGDKDIAFLKQTREPGSGSSARPAADNSAELDELRRRLDRQEELLLDIRDRSSAFQPSTAPAAAPAKTDTIIQRIVEKSGGNGSLSKEDLRELTTEMSRMNIEISNLRRRLAAEEDRRRDAEDDVRRALSRDNNDRTESWEAERLRYERDLNRARRDADRNRPAGEPVVIEREGPVRIVRDTVYVDRERLQPVLIPQETRTDTVVIVKETIREAEPTVVKDTVVIEKERTVIQDRDVVRTDTVKLKATEPISFPTIFFDNNSSRLNNAHLNLLATTANQLRGRENYFVRLTGYSSPSGNAAYNKTLSAKRAEAVREGLRRAGLDPERIVIIPGGIDYEPVNAAAARRVEVQALPK